MKHHHRPLDITQNFSLSQVITACGLSARCRRPVWEAALSNMPSILVNAPLYEQVQKLIRSRILAGEWRSREPLPGEVSLSQEFGVSIGTVRKAMDQLMRENLVVRERGRGTFVRQGADRRSGITFRLKDPNGAPISAKITLVSRRVDPATPEEARLLRPQGSVAQFMRSIKLVREWHLSRKLLCRETIIVDELRFPGLIQSPGLDTETLFALYNERYKTPLDAVRWQIGDSTSLGPIAIDIEAPKAPTISIKRLAMDQRGEPIELCEQLVSLAECTVELAR